jgi:hypothetical protein
MVLLLLFHKHIPFLATPEAEVPAPEDTTTDKLSGDTSNGEK